MNTTETLLLASYFDQQTKQAGLGDAALGAANFGSYFIPGVGTARMGYDAYKDFAGGNYLGGAANLLGAGLSLIPGAGGFLGKGVSALGRIGAKGLARVGAPALSRAVGAGGSMAGKGLSAWGGMMDKVGPALGRGAQSVARSMPTIGGNRLASGIGRAGQTIMARPGTTAAVGAGGVIGGTMAGEAGVAARQAQAQQANQMGGMMQQLRRRPVMTNPIWAKPGGM